jgi:integrase
MPLKIFKRGGIWHYRGTVAGRRLRRSTGTANREIAQRLAAEIEGKTWKCRLDGPEAVLTFAQAAIRYRGAGKSTRYLAAVALANNPRSHPRVFGYAHRAAVFKMWNRAIRAAGIERLSCHSCRHGYATAMLRAGIDPVTVAKLGGWKSTRHLFETYGHALDDVTVTDLIADTSLTQPTHRNARSTRKIRIT